MSDTNGNRQQCLLRANRQGALTLSRPRLNPTKLAYMWNGSGTKLPSGKQPVPLTDWVSEPAVLVIRPTDSHSSLFHGRNHHKYSLSYPWRDGQAELAWVDWTRL